MKEAQQPYLLKTSNLSKAHVTRDTSNPVIFAINVQQ